MLTTDRLVLRCFEPDDVDSVAALLGDPVAMRYVGAGLPLGRGASEERMQQWRSSPGPGGIGVLAVVLTATGELIGYCGVETGEDTGELELTYGLLPAHWGRGLALEAATAVVAHADGFLGVLLATADPRNSASVRILARLGFRLTHTGEDVHGLETAFFRRTRPLASQDAC